MGITVTESFNVPNGFSVHEIEAARICSVSIQGLYHELNEYIVTYTLIGCRQVDMRYGGLNTFENLSQYSRKDPCFELRTDIVYSYCAKEQMK